MRDVIRVERLPEPAAGTPDAATLEAWDGPSIDGQALAAIGRVADEVLPSIVARLAVSGLGEIEVRHGDWHIRVRRTTTPGAVDGRPPSGGGSPAGEMAADTDATAPATHPAHPSDVATSPAVGWFVPRPELAVGSRTTQGDVIGWVDMLGVRQEVVAPADGLVGKLFVGPGDPVEYGQELVQLVAGGTRPDRATQDGTDT